MDQEKAKRILQIYNWVRVIILILFFALVCYGISKAQSLFIP